MNVVLLLAQTTQTRQVTKVRGQTSTITAASHFLQAPARAHTHAASVPLPHWLPPVGQSGHASAIEHTQTTQKHANIRKHTKLTTLLLYRQTHAHSLCVGLFWSEKVSVSRLKDHELPQASFSQTAHGGSQCSSE